MPGPGSFAKPPTKQALCSVAAWTPKRKKKSRWFRLGQETSYKIGVDGNGSRAEPGLQHGAFLWPNELDLAGILDKLVGDSDS